MRPLLICALLGGLLSLLLGMDAGFDLRNYHWHNPWALLSGRLGWDFAPAQLQGFNNPLIDLPFYLLARLHPAMAGLGLGALHGLGWGCVWILARRRGLGRLPSACVAALGVGPITLGVHGGTSGDATVSTLLLGALVASAWGRGTSGPGGSEPAPAGSAGGAPSPRAAPDRGGRSILASGALTGLAVGLKLTAAPFGLAWLLAAGSTWNERVRWLAAAAAGFTLTAGWWMAWLGWRFGSPLFPQFNTVLRSPWAPITSFTEIRYLPDGVLGHLAFPLAMLGGGEVGWEFAWRGGLLPLALLAALSLGWTAQPKARRLAALFVLSWLLWQGLFSAARYAVVLELLAPLLLALLLRPWLRPRYLAPALAVAWLWQRPPPVERVPWQADPFSVQLPSVPEGAFVLLAGDDATSYLLPSFPPSTRFARISGNLAHFDEDTRLNEAMARAIAEHRGALLLLEGPNPATPGALAYHGLKPLLPRCQPVLSRLDQPLQLCPLVRTK